MPSLRSTDEQLEKAPRFREPIAFQKFLSPEQTQVGASAVPAQNVGISPYGNSFFQGEIQGPALVPGKTGALPNLFETTKKEG